MAAEKPSSDARRQRLARALKANIARRKVQARELEKARPDPEPAAPESADPKPATPETAGEDGCPN